MWPTSGQGGYIKLAAWQGAQNERCPTDGSGGYITPTSLGVHNASKRRSKPQVAHKWAV